MKPEDQVLDSQQRQALQVPTAPEGLWSRIEQAVTLELESKPSSVAPSADLLGGVSRFQQRIRFAAAGMLGFMMFFGLEQMVTQSARGSVTTSIAASGLHMVDHLQQDVPLLNNPSAYVDGMQSRSPWPEVTLATYISNSESNE